MKRTILTALAVFVLCGTAWGQMVQPLTTEGLNHLAAREGKSDACENNGRFEIHLSADSEVMLYKLEHGQWVQVSNNAFRLPRGTHVEKDPSGKYHYTCIGGFQIKGNLNVSSPRKKSLVPKQVLKEKDFTPLPQHLLITVEVKHSGEFTINHKLDRESFTLLRNINEIEENDGASAMRKFSHKEERCFDSGTGLTFAGATAAGYFVGARNPDGTNAEIRNNNRGLLIGIGVAAIGAIFLPGTPECKAGSLALGFGGGYLFGRTVKSPDEVGEEPSPPTPVVQPPPPGDQPGGIPPPAPPGVPPPN